ncbi:MAG TPA: hypothetical protein VKZ49_13490, partial [Polyangiaceae bacterium]|nr:hypothetical protein [Polyangiaceae bacterium]
MLGFNNNVRHHGRIFHIQTEDSGIKHPRIVTHLFADGGRIVKTTRTEYSEHIGRADIQDVLRKMMKDQHKAMFIALRSGEFDDLIEQAFGAAPARAAKAGPAGDASQARATGPAPARVSGAPAAPSAPARSSAGPATGSAAPLPPAAPSTAAATPSAAAGPATGSAAPLPAAAPSTAAAAPSVAPKIPSATPAPPAAASAEPDGPGVSRAAERRTPAAGLPRRTRRSGHPRAATAEALADPDSATLRAAADLRRSGPVPVAAPPPPPSGDVGHGSGRYAVSRPAAIFSE